MSDVHRRGLEASGGQGATDGATGRSTTGSATTARTRPTRAVGATSAPAGAGDPHAGRGSHRPLAAREIAVAIGRPTPTPEQVAVIEAPQTSLLVVAGAGSGKTDTMASRVVWLVANGFLRPSEVLGLTFTRKAAGELAARINGRLALLADAGLWGGAEAEAALGVPPTISTYHAYAGRLVAEHGLRLGVEPDARLLSQAAAWQFAHEAVTRYDGPMEDVDAAESTVTAAVVSLAGELAEHLREPQEVADLARRMIERIDALPQGASRARGLPREVKALRKHLFDQLAVLPIVEAYQRLKRERDCLDFADQMAHAARLAEQAAPVRDGERARYRAVLLDEFQDTSEAQLRLLHALFAAESPGGMPASPVMAVGDPHQSIYGWRGASATTLDAFVRRFTPADGPTGGGREGGAVPVLPLSTSWRNDSGVLAVANATAAPLARVSAVPVERLVPAPGAGAGIAVAGRYETAQHEARAAAARIAGHWWADAARTVQTGATAAVLCRRRAQFPTIVDALRAEGLPVEVVGLGGLLTTPEVSDLVALLGVVDDPARGDLLMRLLTGPRTRLGAADLAALGAWSRRRHAAQTRRAPGLADDPGPDAGVHEVAGRGTGAPGAAADPRVGQGSGASFDGQSTGVAPPHPVSADAGARAPQATSADAPAGGGGEVHDVASLVEAMSELPPERWRGPEGEFLSVTARERLTELATVVADLRAISSLALPELVVQAERALGLDVELSARPDVPESVARVHLEAFVDAVADFTAHADRPTLGGFLSWLDAAREQERGLDMPVVGANDHAVQVLTVHAAKGLEWDVVVVPGLVEGAFPSHRAGVSSVRDGVWRVGSPKDRGWTGGLDALPYELRGDVAGLPVVPWRSVADCATLDADLTAFQSACGAHLLLEERRLAYVAFTRARHALYLSASVWTDAATPRVTSRFLTEVLELPGLVDVAEWASMPPTDEPVRNPLAADPPRAAWPPERESARRDVVVEAAERVKAWRRESAGFVAGVDAVGAPGSCTVAATADGADEDGTTSDRAHAEMAALDAEIAALLAERDRARRPVRDEIELPGHLSASTVVALTRDPRAFAARLRRPMPEPPAVQARRGTAFHEWVEDFYGRSALFDLDDDMDDAWDVEGDDAVGEQAPVVAWDTAARPGDDLERLRELFLAGPWAQRTPIEVEVDVETVLAGVPVRGRLDAVFRRADGGYVIVDWKTGRVPDAPRLDAMTVQLAVYALAYRRLHGLGVADVDAAFYFAASGKTVHPTLPDDDALEARLGELFSATTQKDAQGL